MAAIWENKNGVLSVQFEAPLPAQLPFFLATQRHIGYGGARGPGKSWSMRTKFVLLANTYAGLKLILFRRTLKELEENHIEPLYKMLVPSGLAKYNDSKKIFTFLNGSTLRMGYCDTQNDVYKYQGAEYDVMGFEEATHFTEQQVEFLLTSNRSTRKDFSARAYYTCNPGNVGHAWVKRLFVSRNFTAKENPDDYVFFRAYLDDNPFLSDTGYREDLEKLPENLRRAHLLGDWDVFGGQYFAEFNRDVHVVEPFVIPSNWRKFRSLDYGLDMTSCHWWAVDEAGTCFIYRELHEKGLILSAAAQAILRASPTTEIIKYTVASPDLWNARQDTGKSGADIFLENGIKNMQKADNRRIAGWRVLKEYLKHDKNAPPKLKIFSNCTNIIENLPLLQYDKKKIEDVAGEPHDITHAPESVRYGVMSNPMSTIKKPPERYPIGYQADRYTKPDNSGNIFGYDAPII